MSDVKKRLNLLKKKKTQKKAASKPPKSGDPDAQPGDPKSQPAAAASKPSSALNAPESAGHAGTADPAKKKTLDSLRSMIARVESQPGRRGVLEQMNRKPLARPPEPDNAVRDHAPGGGAGILEEDLFEGPGQNIEDLINGDYLDTPHGPCFRVRTEYPWQYHQGDVPVSTLLDREPSALAMLSGDPELAGLDFQKTLFFDTETTGLDTGAGVYIFLAGLGWFQERTFVVEQYFMRDFPEEPAVLHALAERMAGFTGLVTYNGKTYDWPLLESRFAMNRRPLPMDRPLHLDLLHAARRLYRHRLENCRLPSVEAGVLNFHRVDDMPGALLPERYFRYVRSRDARFIHKAFAHNAHDIVSMAAVLSAMIEFMDDPMGSTGHRAEDIYALGRLRELNRDEVGAIAAYTEALNRRLQPNLYSDALQRLSLVLKRCEEWDRACEIWQHMIQTAGLGSIFPHVELAKYHEHRRKDFKEARRWVMAALEHLPHCLPVPPGIRNDLEYRLRRIETRLRGDPWQPGRRDVEDV